MTTYLARKNRSVRLQKIQDRIFEETICRLDIIGKAAALFSLVLFGLGVFALVLVGASVIFPVPVEVAIK